MSCLRRNLKFNERELPSIFTVQTREKKSTTKKLPATVKVRLLRDMTTWGKKGTILAVAPGRMRNVWYPFGKAEYVTMPELKQLGKNVIADRDTFYGVNQEQVLQSPEAEKEGRKQEIQVALLDPARATVLLDKYISRIIDFYRTPIATPEPSKPERAPAQSSLRGSISPAMLEAERKAQGAPVIEEETLSESEGAAIYGSVTTADITSNIKAVLAMNASEDEDVARIVLNTEDVIFVRAEKDMSGQVDRVKALGEYEVEIKIKDAGAIRRTVRVRPVQLEKGDEGKPRRT
ncbi:hypothetical protein MMC25_001145 [Agyrium rufum]|nr:hypothetical protein [Agyrium rufum]